MKGSVLYAVSAWLPVAVLVALKIYVSQFEGWGAWAAAPLFLIPLALSLIIGLVGVAIFARRRAAERRDLRAITMLILPWLPILYFVAAYYWRQLMLPAI